MARVYFASSRVPNFREWWVPEQSLLKKMERVFFSAGLDGITEGIVGIKVHMGEPGDVHYLRPVYVSKMVDIIRNLGGKPMVVETSGLGWTPGRTSASKQLEAARRNGFSEGTLGAPIVLMDGEMGMETAEGSVVARGLSSLDSLMVLSHVTGHIQAGYGGAIKNLGLGCVAKIGKYRVHFEGLPRINEKCDMCGECLDICPVDAIKEGVITEKCVGCIACVDICPRGAVKIKETSLGRLSVRIAENASEVVKMATKVGYINLLVDVLPHCDCHPHSDIPIIPDLGVLSSLDPVAIDKASIDLLNSAPGILFSEAEKAGALDPGTDKLSLINPETNWKLQLKTAEKLGMGRQEYNLIELET
jgi:hypothetical protein